jgi:hypothetical protein
VAGEGEGVLWVGGGRFEVGGWLEGGEAAEVSGGGGVGGLGEGFGEGGNTREYLWPGGGGGMAGGDVKVLGRLAVNQGRAGATH